MTNPELLSQSLTPDFLRNQSNSHNDHPSQWEAPRYTVEDQQMTEEEHADSQPTVIEVIYPDLTFLGDIKYSAKCLEH